MDIDIKELIRTATEGLDLSKFKGDVVGFKYVENEFGTIEEGGIGVQKNYYCTKEGNTPTLKDYKLAPMSQYVTRYDKVNEVLSWLHTNIDNHSEPKDKLEFLKAAIECRPRAIQDSITVEVFNLEFNTNISMQTFRNWIKGYHESRYEEADFYDLKDEISEIMQR